MEHILGACCDLYNACLEQRKIAWKHNRVNVRKEMQMLELPELKLEFPEIGEVNSQVLQNVVRRVDSAFEYFFRRVARRTEKVGYPRFKTKKRYDSFTYPQFDKRVGVCFIENKLRLSKIGAIKIKQHRVIDGKIKTVTIQKSKTGKWFACFACQDVPQKILPNNDRAVGVDMGIQSFATLSDGTKIENPRFFVKDEKELSKAQRKLSKTKIGTPLWNKRRKIVARIYERINNRRSDFAHKLSRELINNFGIICFEKLYVDNMRQNKIFAKSIGDAAWMQLIHFTAYKAEDAGRQVIESDARGTSQECSDCGAIVKKDIKVRVHICGCGAIYDRDHNAARNILRRGLASLGISP